MSIGVPLAVINSKYLWLSRWNHSSLAFVSRLLMGRHKVGIADADETATSCVLSNMYVLVDQGWTFGRVFQEHAPV